MAIPEQQLAAVKCHQMHIVFGMVSDKDVDQVMKLLPKNATYYFTKADTKRAIPETAKLVLGNRTDCKGNAIPL